MQRIGIIGVVALVVTCGACSGDEGMGSAEPDGAIGESEQDMTASDCYEQWKLDMLGCNALAPEDKTKCMLQANAWLGVCLAIVRAG